jgi:hypothetical protein
MLPLAAFVNRNHSEKGLYCGLFFFANDPWAQGCYLPEDGETEFESFGNIGQLAKTSTMYNRMEGEVKKQEYELRTRRRPFVSKVHDSAR